MRDSHRGGSLPSLVPEAPTADEPTATRSEREGRWASRCHGVDGVPIDIVDATGRYNVCVFLGIIRLDRTDMVLLYRLYNGVGRLAILVYA